MTMDNETVCYKSATHAEIPKCKLNYRKCDVPRKARGAVRTVVLNVAGNTGIQRRRHQFSRASEKQKAYVLWKRAKMVSSVCEQPSIFGSGRHCSFSCGSHPP